MIFTTIIAVSFIYGAVRGYRQWRATQPQFVQKKNTWRN